MAKEKRSKEGSIEPIREDLRDPNLSAHQQWPEHDLIMRNVVGGTACRRLFVYSYGLTAILLLFVSMLVGLG
jgi:hypothetical protein